MKKSNVGFKYLNSLLIVPLLLLFNSCLNYNYKNENRTKVQVIDTNFIRKPITWKGYNMYAKPYILYFAGNCYEDILVKQSNDTILIVYNNNVKNESCTYEKIKIGETYYLDISKLQCIPYCIGKSSIEHPKDYILALEKKYKTPIGFEGLDSLKYRESELDYSRDSIEMKNNYYFMYESKQILNNYLIPTILKVEAK